MATHYAIKTGKVYTVVTVDPDRNQSTVPLASGRGGRLYVEGTGERSIKRAAIAPEGAYFKRLKDAMGSHDNVIRRRDLDT